LSPLLPPTITEDRHGSTPIHPGAVLQDELDELGIPAAELAPQFEMPTNRISQILAVLRRNG
jgi:plasmid maintenance system antidote protein VapI